MQFSYDISLYGDNLEELTCNCWTYDASYSSDHPLTNEERQQAEQAPAFLEIKSYEG